MYAANLAKCQGPLAELVRGTSGTPQVLGSTPRGSEFQVEVKKIPSSVPECQSIGLRHGPGRGRLTWAMMPLCKGGAGVRGFYWPV